ncbi:hypothetical protein NCS52_00773500 [Fusarium sp. LHS14.1]|nr:hypothetical protein NCS52_00773500 [Fusarium sp. LHS14.1]
MLFFLTLFAFAFSPIMGAEVYGRETISFTINAGTLVGAGLIKFSSRQIDHTTGDTEVTVTATAEHSRTACKSAACLETASVTSSAEDTQSTSTPLSILSSRSSPLLPTFDLLPTNISLGATPTPSPTGPKVSGAATLRRTAYTWVLSFVAMGLCALVF